MIVDGAHIDIKTTLTLSFGQEMHSQIVRCCVLSRLGGVNGGDKADIQAIGVYFARYGAMHTVPAGCVRDAASAAFMEAFELPPGRRTGAWHPAQPPHSTPSPARAPRLGVGAGAVPFPGHVRGVQDGAGGRLHASEQ